MKPDRRIIHRLRHTRIYKRWIDMKQRCSNPHKSGFANYGGRGISVCERWLSFQTFYEDMGDIPKGLTLDRINNNKDYSPENCKWSTRKEQARNRNYCKLTMAKANRIREFHWAGIKTKELAKMFGVTKEHVWRVITGQHWA